MRTAISGPREPGVATALNPLLEAFLAGGTTDLELADRYMEEQRPKDAIAIYSTAFYEGVDRERAAAWAARCCLELRVPHEALAWARWLVERDEALGSMLMAAAFCQLGDFEAATDAAEGWEPDVLDRVGLGAEQSHLLAASAHLRRSDFAAAREVILAGLAEDPLHPDLWAFVAVIAAREGVISDAVVAAVPAESLLSVVAWLRHGSPVGAERVLDAMWSQSPGSTALLAAAAECAPYAPVDRATEWATRMRTVGLVSLCPLRRKAGTPEVGALERVQAAMLVHAAFGDADAAELLQDACGALGVADVETALTVVADLDVDLLEAALNGVAVDLPQCLAAARFLIAGEAVDGALALTAHGLELAAADPVWTEVATNKVIREQLGADGVAVLVAGFASCGADGLAARLAAATN